MTVMLIHEAGVKQAGKERRVYHRCHGKGMIITGVRLKVTAKGIFGNSSYNIDRPPDSVASKQSTLRAAQHLYALYVNHTAISAGADNVVYAVEIDTDRRVLCGIDVELRDS